MRSLQQGISGTFLPEGGEKHLLPGLVSHIPWDSLKSGEGHVVLGVEWRETLKSLMIELDF